MKVFLLDNYDSFTYNVVQLLGTLGITPCVGRGAELSPGFLENLSPEKIIISPGPCRPGDHGVIFELLENYCPRVPVLGICLGMQAINEFFGGKTVRAPVPVHGKTSPVYHSGAGILKGVPSPFMAARYHSLAASDIPPALKVTASAEDGVPMALMHRSLPVFGLQFHPESYLSTNGRRIMKNFIEAGG